MDSPAGVWLVVGEQGSYSDYGARIKSVWLTEDEARQHCSQLEQALAENEAAWATWQVAREKLWNEMNPGPTMYWGFYSEEIEEEWLRSVAVLDQPGWLNYDNVVYMYVPLSVPGDYEIMSAR